jgi:hypothetical protein
MMRWLFTAGRGQKAETTLATHESSRAAQEAVPAPQGAASNTDQLITNAIGTKFG